MARKNTVLTYLGVLIINTRLDPSGITSNCVLNRINVLATRKNKRT